MLLSKTTKTNENSLGSPLDNTRGETFHSPERIALTKRVQAIAVSKSFCRKAITKCERSGRFQLGKFLKIVGHVSYSISCYRYHSLPLYSGSSYLSNVVPFYSPSGVLKGFNAKL